MRCARHAGPARHPACARERTNGFKCVRNHLSVERLCNTPFLQSRYTTGGGITQAAASCRRASVNAACLTNDERGKERSSGGGNKSARKTKQKRSGVALSTPLQALSAHCHTCAPPHTCQASKPQLLPDPAGSRALDGIPRLDGADVIRMRGLHARLAVVRHEHASLLTQSGRSNA